MLKTKIIKVFVLCGFITIIAIIIYNCFILINGSIIYRRTTEFNSYTCLYYNSNLTDIKRIGNLCDLKKLTLHSKLIKSLNTLSNLYCLEELTISGCTEIYDWSDLEDINNLKYISLERSTYKDNDIMYLRSLENLKTLNIDGCPINNIENIRYITQINELGLSCPKLTDLSPLEDVINLKYLQLSNMNIKNCDFVNNISNLKILYLNDINCNDNFTGVINSDSVKELYLENMNYIPEDIILKFYNIEVLSLYKSKYTNDYIDTIQRLPKLRKLYIDDNSLTQFEIDSLENNGISVIISNTYNNKLTISAGYIT